MFFSFNNKRNSVQFALEGEILRQKSFRFSNKKYAIEALKKFDKAILLEPDNDMYYASRFLVKMYLKDRDGALSDIEKAIQLNNKQKKYTKMKKLIS